MCVVMHGLILTETFEHLPGMERTAERTAKNISVPGDGRIIFHMRTIAFANHSYTYTQIERCWDRIRKYPKVPYFMHQLFPVEGNNWFLEYDICDLRQHLDNNYTSVKSRKNKLVATIEPTLSIPKQV